MFFIPPPNTRIQNLRKECSPCFLSFGSEKWQLPQLGHPPPIHHLPETPIPGRVQTGWGTEHPALVRVSLPVQLGHNQTSFKAPSSPSLSKILWLCDLSELPSQHRVPSPAQLPPNEVLWSSRLAKQGLGDEVWGMAWMKTRQEVVLPNLRDCTRFYQLFPWNKSWYSPD